MARSIPHAAMCCRTQRGLGHNLLMQFSRLSSSKMEISETDLFDIMTIQNDQISYFKHVLAFLYVFFTLFGCGGGGSQGVYWNFRLVRLSPVKEPVPLPILIPPQGPLATFFFHLGVSNYGLRCRAQAIA